MVQLVPPRRASESSPEAAGPQASWLRGCHPQLPEAALGSLAQRPASTGSPPHGSGLVKASKGERGQEDGCYRLT